MNELDHGLSLFLREIRRMRVPLFWFGRSRNTGLGLIHFLVGFPVYGASFGNGESPVRLPRSLFVYEAELPLIALPQGDHVVTMVEWYSRSGEQLHPPRERRSLLGIQIREPISLGQFEVTQELFRTVTGRVPSHLPGDPAGNLGLADEFPVSFVSADDAKLFCRLLTKHCLENGLIPSDYHIRLPDRAEWQLAAQGGQSSLRQQSMVPGFGLGIPRGVVNDPIAINRIALNQNDIQLYPSRERTDAPWKIGSKVPNRLGFFDLYGNVQEWSVGENRLEAFLSGGTWLDEPTEFGHTATFWPAPLWFRNKTTGFRVALAKRDRSSSQAMPIQSTAYTHVHDYRIQPRPLPELENDPSTYDLHIHSDESIWVATESVLYRFQGGNVRQFDEHHLAGLPDFAVFQIETDERDRLWVFTARVSQIACFDGDKFHALEADQFPGRISRIGVGHTKRLWGVTRSGHFFRVSGSPENSETCEIVAYGPQDVGFEVEDVLEIQEDVLIASGKSHGHYRIDLKSMTTKPLRAANERIRRDVAKGSDRRWSLTHPRFVRHFSFDNQILSQYEVPAVFRINNGWSVNGGGDDGLFVSLPEVLTYQASEGWSYYPEPVIRSVGTVAETDRHGGFWIAGRTHDAGLWRISRGPIESLTVKNGLTKGRAWSTCADGQGGAWLLTGSGVTHWTAQGEMLRYYGDLFWQKQRGVDCVYADSLGRVWVSAHKLNYASHPLLNQGDKEGGRSVILRLDGQAFRHLPLKFSPSTTGRVFAMTEGHDGNLWFGAEKGLLKYREGTETVMYGEEDGLPKARIRLLHEDDDQRLWIGTDGAGIIALNAERDKFVSHSIHDGLSGDSVWSLSEDDGGVLWLGTNQGLTRLKEGVFSPIPASVGLPDVSVNQIFDDQSGHLWVGCNTGIYRVDKQELHDYCDGLRGAVTCVTYGVMDGMEVAETNGEYWPSGCQLSDGAMIFPSPKGFEILRPKELLQSSPPLNVRMESVKTYSDRNAEGGTRELPIDDGRVIFPPGTATAIEIRFGALDYVAPASLRYRYRIGGLFNEWRGLGAKESVYVGELGPGEYVFEVAVKNYRNVWYDSSAAMTLVVQPAWYQTIAARVLAFGCFVSAGLGLPYLWSRRIFHRRVQSQLKQFNQQREEISQDIHDAIGADFSKISAMARSLGEMKGFVDAKEEKMTVERLLETAKEGANNIRRIIWAANPKKDSLDQLVGYTVDVFDRLLRNTQLMCRIDAPDEVANVAVSPFLRHDVVMIVTEAVGNILKHSGAKMARLRIVADVDSIDIQISDDGCGFDLEHVTRGEGGLMNMKKRSIRIGAELSVMSSLKKGTEVHLRARHQFGIESCLNARLRTSEERST